METKVTFTTEVKEEICSLSFERDNLLSLISGFCKVNGILTLSNEGMCLSLKTENSKVAKLIFASFKTLFNVIPNFTYSKKMNLDKGSVFHINIKQKTLEILEELELFKDGMPTYPQSVVLEERLRYFCAGAFLASGSVNSPRSKNYHLQLVVFTEEDAKYFLKLFNRFHKDKEMNFKYLERRNKFVLYLKKADQIATFLSIIFSHYCLFEFENARIEKDYINSDNRVQVCFNANYQKSLETGETQSEEIRYIIDNNGLYLLNQKEQLVAQVRLENNDASLTKLTEILREDYQIDLSKSGVNHILNKIHQKYQSFKYDREH